MCFSVSASFGVSSFLAFCAIVVALKARKTALVVCSLIPTIFAVQQSAEGIIWLYARNTHWLYTFATYIFLLGAAAWPGIIPAVIAHIETNPKRRQLLTLLSYAGALVSGTMILYVALHVPQALIDGRHITYTFASSSIIYALPSWIFQALYVFFVTAPLALSTRWGMRVGALLVLASFVASHVWYQHHVTSIWCFFAAVLSSCLVLFVFHEEAYPERIGR